MIDQKFCKVSSTESYICDPEKYLTENTKKLISAHLKNIKLKSPKSCIGSQSGESQGLVLGVVVISKISTYKYPCEGAESPQSCFTRNIMKEWHMSSCGNDAVILLEENSKNTISSVHFGREVKRFLSRTCIIRIKRDVEQLLTTSKELASVINRIYLYTTNSDTCMLIEENVNSKIKTELLVGLIVGSTTIFILLVFLISYWRRRNSPNEATERRNSNIVRPLNVISEREQSELPPMYSSIIFDTDKEKSKIIVVKAAPDSKDPPTYLDVIGSPLFTQKNDLQL